MFSLYLFVIITLLSTFLKEKVVPNSMRGLVKRNIKPIIFGLQDGLVSTMGVITGIAEGSRDKFIILLSGLIVVVVEALSMASGEYLSSKSETELTKKRVVNPKVAGIFMGVSYMVGGSVPVIPYIFASGRSAIYLSVLATMFALFIVGYVKSKFVKVDALKGGLEMLIIAGASALVGYIVGYLGRIYLN